MVSHEFLTLLERLSQIYLNSFTIVACLLLVKVYLLKTSINTSLSDLQDNIHCDPSQKPLEISNLINGIILNNLSQVKYNYLVILKVLLSTIKSLILFYVEIFLGTFTCLLNATIHGTTKFAFDSTQKVIVTLNDTISDIADDIQDGLDGLSFVINKLISTFNSIKTFFTGSVPGSGLEYKDKIQISIKGLKNIAIPASVLTDIDNFKQKEVPFFDLQNSTQELISAPFEFFSRQLLASSLNSTLLRNKTLLSNESLPVLKSLDPFCENSVKYVAKYQNLTNDINLAAKFIIIFLICAATISLLPFIWKEYTQWKREMLLSREILKAAKDDLTHFHNVLNRHNNSIVYFLYKSNLSKSSYILWLTTYITSSYALTVLFVGILGLLSSILLFIIVRLLSKLDIDTNIDISSLKSFQTASELYINQTNMYILSQQESLNTELFGHIRDVSHNLNSTIVNFMGHLNSSITSVFGNTPFDGPLNTVVYCTIGRKLEKIELALTWIHSRLKIEIPLMPQDILSEIVRLTNDNSQKIHSVMANSFDKLVTIYTKALWIEFIVSICIVGAWFLQLIIGLLVIWARIWVQKNENVTGDEPMDIGDPKPLTLEEKNSYGYPISTPIHDRFGVYDLKSKKREVPLSSVYDE